MCNKGLNMAGQSVVYESIKPRKLSILANYEKTVLSAFKSDCESVLEQLEKAQTLNYAHFANIWQINNFTYIYADQTYVGPLKILCEVCFMTVKKYFMFQESLYIRVGAFYLLYGLYYKQPIQGMVKIRLTLDEYKKLKLLMDEMAERGQNDIVYIFAKMKSDNAFLYVKEPKPLYLELNKCIKSLTHLDDTFQSRGTESSINKFKNILEDETVQVLQKTSSEYDSLLKKFAEKHPSIQFKSTIIHELKQAYSKVFVDPASTESNLNDQSGDANVPIRSSRQSIRLKAMQNQNAEYRGSKIVLTAVNLEEEGHESHADHLKIKSSKRRGRPKGKKNTNARKGSSKTKNDEESD